MDPEDIHAAFEEGEEEEEEETTDVMAWSSTHLSEDDSDSEDASASSRSPSRSVESSDDPPREPMEEGRSEHNDAASVNDELGEDWVDDVDVDLPDGTSSPPRQNPAKHAPTSSLVATIKDPPTRSLSTHSSDAGLIKAPSDTTHTDDDHRSAVRSPEPVASSSSAARSRGLEEADPSPFKEEHKPRPVSQIPRVAPPLTRKYSLNAATPTSPPLSPLVSPPRLQRSPSKTQSLGAVVTVVEPPASLPKSPPRRGQSVYIPQGTAATRTATTPSQRGMIVPTSSQFWANEQNRRSSRLLDEWKRKEIWHDFKRAEENVLSVNPSTTEGTAIDVKLGAASSLDDVLQGIRADILTKQGGGRGGSTRPPLRRATSFATKSSPDKANGTDNHDAWELRAAAAAVAVAPMQHQQAKTQQPRLVSESVSRAEYERLLEDKRRFADEAESRHRALLAEQEASRALQEKLVNLENSDRENRFLKEEIQKLLMHELSSKELVKTLEDQLTLTARSEDQLKMQTRQLMQQNQALQSDLLEKMAAETSKIQKMAHLSAEKQKLQEDLQRHEAQSAQKVAQQRTQVRATMLRHMLSTKRLGELKYAFTVWRSGSSERTAALRKGATALLALAERLHIKALARSFHCWYARAREASSADQLHHAEQVLAAAHDGQRGACRRAGAVVLSGFLRRQSRVDLQTAWRRWQCHASQQKTHEQRLTTGAIKLQAVFKSRVRANKQRAFSTWMLQVFFDGQRFDCEHAKQTEAELVEAKDCVFGLSRAKTRLEEKLASARQDAQRASDQLREHRSELQLVKHGFVTTVIRSTERQWLRSLFDAWKVETKIEACAKEFRLQLEMAELQVEEREKYARSLDDYNKVLRNDLERFQFFSQDKRVAVDVLTKKLLREEDKLRHMEEQHVVLEEKMLAYKAQLSSLLEWESGGGATMPLALIHLCRDAAIGNLRELFGRLATATSRFNDDKAYAPSSPEISTSDAALDTSSSSSAGRVAITDLVQFLRDSTPLSDSSVAQSDLGVLVCRHAPEYSETQGLAFAEFVTCLNAIAKEAFETFSAPKERVKVFWSSLLSRVLGSGGGNNGLPRGTLLNHAHRDVGDAAALHTGRSPWAGQLSEDILQNQEKLLAVLEHETAVVERAVMEKSSLKHTYAPSELSVGSTIKEFQEYQCEPVVPHDSQPSSRSPAGGSGAATPTATGAFSSADCQFQESGLSQFANWSQSGQVQDLFLAFRLPLQRAVTKYSNEKRVAAHGNQVCLLLSGVARMLEDMRLYPAYLSRDLVHYHFGRLCDRDGLLTPQALAMFLGCCALELFAKSLPAANSSGFRLSAREIALSFFCDLGLLPESEIPAPPRICMVGADVETVLWPLFEYYSLSEDQASSAQAEEPRVGMTQQKFVRFAADIVNTGATAAERLFQRVLGETRRPGAASSISSVVLHLDEFYVALAYLQAERCHGVQYANLGEAVRHWMQQTQ